MKLTLLLIPLLFLTSCTIDWNDEKGKKITELERQITELNSKNNDELFKKNKECFTYRDKVGKYSNFKSLESIFYSPIRKSCLAIIEYTDENDFFGSFKMVSDILNSSDLFRDTDKTFDKTISFEEEIKYLQGEENFIKTNTELEKKKNEINEKAKIYFGNFIKNKLGDNPTKEKLSAFMLTKEFKDDKEFQIGVQNIKDEAAVVGGVSKTIFRELYNK